LQKLYADIDPDNDPEVETYTFEQAKADLAKIKTIKPPPPAPKKVNVTKPAGWPFDKAGAVKMQGSNGSMTVNTPGGNIVMRKIPAGSFVMGSATGHNDEIPCVVKIAKPFYMAEMEVRNALYKKFDPKHDSGWIDTLGKDHGNGGIHAVHDKFPVIRVSWDEANAFCKWLSDKTGKKFRLPTEAEWEWAARAGSENDFYWGGCNDDFGKFANLSDSSMKRFDKISTFNYMLRVDKVNDGSQIQTEPKKYQPNAFGLHDMIGNVAEWTSSDYRPYPYKDAPPTKGSEKVSRGGSWRDLPRWARVSRRVPYQPYQRVYNVGIRLVME
jgi:formylglycine-generating enzyme required for sulfatase activity